MRTHLAQEAHQRERCIYCSKDLTGMQWTSEFHGHLHYKTAVCPGCSSKKSIKVRFGGTGHDSWNGKEKLEDKIEKEHKENGSGKNK